MSENLRPIVIGLGTVIAVGVLARIVVHSGPAAVPVPPPLVIDERLAAVLDEIKSLDPRWQFAELEEDRAKVPDGENAAPLVVACANMVPDKLNGRNSQDIRFRLRAGRSDEKPREDIAPAKEVLSQARKLAAFSRGRHDVKWDLKDPLLTLLPHVTASNEVIDLLTLDAEVLAHEGDVDAALVSVRAALVAARAIGDEPMMASQWQRPGWHHLSVEALEESLRRGQATEEKLLAVQSALEAEAGEPILWTAARGERAGLHGLMTALEKGELTRGDPLLLDVRAEGVELILNRQSASRAPPPLQGIHAWVLDYATKFVEITRLPSEKQAPRLKELAATLPHGPREALPMLKALLVEDLAQTCHKGQALLRCAAAGLALERYRLANGRWPENLEELTPKYLTKGPADPFNGRALRYARFKDLVVVSSVGPGGKEAAPNVNFRLWDADKRLRPAK